jgi:tellurite resistance protein
MLGLGKMFGSKAKEAVNQFTGNKDFLEGLCAICCLVAAADGNIDDKEIDAALASIKANSAISSSFGAQEIESVFGKMSTKVGNRQGRMALKTEIQEVVARDKTGTMGSALILAGLDVADQGGIGAEEETVLKDLAKLVGADYAKLAAG